MLNRELKNPIVFREPRGPPPPVQTDYNYEYYAQSYRCEVKEVSLGGWNF